MKVRDIVKQTEKYRKLSSVIRQIEQNIKDFDRIRTICLDEDDNYHSLCTGTITLDGKIVHSADSDGYEKKQVEIYLNRETTELVRGDVGAVLKKHLAELKNQRDGLEV